MSEVYAITDIVGYASQMRECAAQTISETYEDDIDSYINIEQMISLVKENCLGFDDQDRPLLNEETNEEIFGNTITWIYNIGLAKLAAKDLVECAWDDKSNEMIFWSKESTNEQLSNKKRKNKKSRRSDS